MKLEADEKEILESIERKEWKSAGGGKCKRGRYSRYAKATFRKDRRLNIRLSSKDLEAIQRRALAEGLPYQTLISSLLRKYASGRAVRRFETATTHNARHQLALDSRCFCASVPRVLWSVIAKSGDLAVGFDEGGGLKNRCKELKKNADWQVLACRILTVCGEVAERLKAAVC
jgi:predicted DNA binding CopG/RHH family protein